MVGAPSRFEDSAFFLSVHRLAGDGEEHICVFVRDPVFEWEGLGCSHDRSEGGMSEGQLTLFQFLGSRFANDALAFPQLYLAILNDAGE